MKKDKIENALNAEAWLKEQYCRNYKKKKSTYIQCFHTPNIYYKSAMTGLGADVCFFSFALNP